MGAKALNLLKEKYSMLSLLSPLVIYGQVSSPQVKQMSSEVETDFGPMSFHVIIDEMSVDINRFLDQYQDAKERNQKIMELASHMFTDIEGAHHYMLDHMQGAIDQINLLMTNYKQDSQNVDVFSEFERSIAKLTLTRNSIHQKYSKTISKIGELKTSLIDHLIICTEELNNESTKITLSGILGPNANLDFLKEVDSPSLILNMSRLTDIHPEGILLWNQSIKAVPKETKIYYDYVSKEVLNIISENPSFHLHGYFRSISAPFQCSSCGISNTMNFSAKALAGDVIPHPICCDQEMELAAWTSKLSDCVKHYTESLKNSA